MRLYAIVLLLLTLLTGVTTYNPAHVEIKEQEFTIIIPKVPKPKRIPELSVLGVNVDQFLFKLGKAESNNNYYVVNRFGYMGKYQFGKKTLYGLVRMGYLKATSKELANFINDPELQEKAIDALIRHNLDLLKRRGLLKHVGKSIAGHKVTVEGMLAAAHLLGPEAVRHYVVTGGSMREYYIRGVKIRKSDGNNTTITDYFLKFTPQLV